MTDAGLLTGEESPLAYTLWPAEDLPQLPIAVTVVDGHVAHKQLSLES